MKIIEKYNKNSILNIGFYKQRYPKFKFINVIKNSYLLKIIPKSSFKIKVEND